MLNLANISFPVYKVGLNEPTIDESKAYYIMGKDLEYSDAQIEIRMIDDRTIRKKSLGMRRLALQAQGHTLHKLSYAIFFVGDFIKIAKAGMWFIDSRGYIFTYKKTKRVPLVFRRIVKLLPVLTGGSIVEVEGTPIRFKTLYAPSSAVHYAGLLVSNRSYILYGLYENKPKDTNRMI